MSGRVLRDGGMVLAMLVCGIGVWIAGFAKMWPGPAITSIPAVSIGLMLAASAAQTLRSVRPALCFALGTVILIADMLMGMTVPVWIIYSDIVFAAALYGSARTARAMLVCAGAISIVFATMSAILSDDWRQPFLLVVLLGAVIGAPAAYGYAIREHRNAAAIADQRGEALAELAFRDHQRDITAQRQQIARDLHDGVAGHLSAIALTTEAGMAANGQQQQEILKSVRRNALDALDDMRSMIAMLHDDTVDDVTVVTMRRLDQLVRDAEVSGTPITVAGSVPDLPREIDITAFRILSEAVTNCRRHAPGMPISVRIDHHDDVLTLTVSNPIAPLAIPKSEEPERNWDARLGLRSMRVRAQAVNGSLNVRPGEKTFEVSAQLPTTTGQAPGTDGISMQGGEANAR